MNSKVTVVWTFLSAGLVAGGLAADPGADEYLPERLAGAWRNTHHKPSEEVSISLRGLEREARAAARPGRLTLGDLTDISGVIAIPGENDVAILGMRGDPEVEPILLDEFVTALRIGPAFYMSLDPVEGMKNHRLRFGPKALEGSSFLAGLTRADYFVKAMAVGLIESSIQPSRAISDLYACGQSSAATEAHTQANVFFQPGNVSWERSENGLTLRLRSLVVTLVAGKNTASLQRDFADGFNQHYAEILEKHPRVFKRLRNLFKLHQIAHVLHALSERTENVDLKYWLQTFRGEPQEIPTNFPGFPPRRFATFCNGSRGFGERMMDIYGGVLSRWVEKIPGHEERTFSVYVNGSDLLALRPDMSFVQRTWSARSPLAAAHGSFFRSPTGSVHLVSTTGAEEVLTRHGSRLLRSDGTSLVDIFSKEREGEDTPGRMQALAPGRSGMVLVDSAWLAQYPEESSALRRELLLVEDLAQRTPEERQLIREIERALGLEANRKDGAEAERTGRGKVDASGRRINAPVAASEAALALEGLADRLEEGIGIPGTGADPKVSNGLAYGRILRLAAERYRVSSRVAEALELGGQSLAVINRVMGRESADYADALAFLGAVYSETGNYERGEALLFEAKNLFETAAPRDDRRARALYGLGDHYASLGLYKNAVSSYESGVSLLRSSLSKNSGWIAEGLGGIGWSLLEEGDTVGAQRAVEEALGLASDANRGLGLYLAKILARIHYLREEYKAALSILEAAVAGAPEEFFESGAAMASLSNDLGLIYWGLGRKEEAREAVREAVLIHEAGAFEAHPSRARILINYGSLLVADHRYREAEARLEQGILIAKEILGDTHPEHIRGLEARASLESSRGRWKSAQATEAEAEELRRKRDRSGEGIDFRRMMDVLDRLWAYIPHFSAVISGQFLATQPIDGFRVAVSRLEDHRGGLCLPEPQEVLDLSVVGDAELEELGLLGRDDAVAVAAVLPAGPLVVGAVAGGGIGGTATGLSATELGAQAQGPGAHQRQGLEGGADLLGTLAQGPFDGALAGGGGA